MVPDAPPNGYRGRRLDLVAGGLYAEAAMSDSVLPVTPAERAARQPHQGAVVWFTGLSGAGKSTLATALERALFDRGVHVQVLDGDIIRTGLSADLGFGEADRAENIRRIGEVAALFASAGVVAIAAFISPYRADRDRARRRLAEVSPGASFLEVHVDAPLGVCETRDPKGLYKKARAGQIPQFTGVSAPYEPPLAPEVVVKTGDETLEACIAQLLVGVLPRIAK
jgi:adenylyl-sulfate kinase